MKQLKEVERKRISEYTTIHPSAEYYAGGDVWSVPCDIALPCATQNEINADQARALVKKWCYRCCRRRKHAFYP